MLNGNLAVVTAEFDGVDHLLLGEKKYGRDAGRLVLPGGKDEVVSLYDYPLGALFAIEHPHQAVFREVREETGVDLRDGDTFAVGTIGVDFSEGVLIEDEFTVALYRSIFTGSAAMRQQLEDNAELTPDWYEVHDLPLERLQGDVRIWLPTVLGFRDRDALPHLHGFIRYERSENTGSHKLASSELYFGSLQTRLQRIEPEPSTK